MYSEKLYVFPNSIHKHKDSDFCIAKTEENEKVMIVSGPDKVAFDGKDILAFGKSGKQCPLSSENSLIIRELFSFTNPIRHKGHKISIGLGDRLGLASGGHIRLLRNLDVFPVLAQQSMRELNLTGRTYEDVLAAAVWAVFQEGYTKGFGADGDHLKTHEEVKYALDCGFTMITLDCSEHIPNGLDCASQAEINTRYADLSDDITGELENMYLNKTVSVDTNTSLSFNSDDFKRIVLVYFPAVKHAIDIFNNQVKGKNVDFEISIDETLSATSPQAHYFVANELIKHGVEITGLAPRFVGEFQKGIDYKGDISGFECNFSVHAIIAKMFGYKISVHSGSDKFSVFPIVNKCTDGRYHLKTAGTNWLEAVRVVAMKSPELYREIHSFALSNLTEAKKYYHITEDVGNIVDLCHVSDHMLPDCLNQDDARQVLHITYGLILQAKKEDGAAMFRDRIFDVLNVHESEYYNNLEIHIGKHLTELGIVVNAKGISVEK